MVIENLSVNDLRKRMFTKKSSMLFEKSKYTFQDDVPEQIEKLEGFTNWESFSEEWDILWVGIDQRSKSWIPGRHHSPVRKIVSPLTIVTLDNRTKRMNVSAPERVIIGEIPLPKQYFPETEADLAISESLSGKVVIDEPDEDKAARLIEETMAKLQIQLEAINRTRTKNGSI